MTSVNVIRSALTHVDIVARDLNEVWFLCLSEVLANGYEYKIDKGSFEGSSRKEFDLVSVKVLYPGTKPLAPTTPVGVPCPTSDEYIQDYLRYLMTSVRKENETYTYGEDLEPQIPKVIELYKRFPETNICCMSVGSKDSINDEHSQCLRLVDTRIRYGALHFIVYFRSWDLWAGFPTNMAGLQLMKEYMASEIGVKDGELIAFGKGLHLYDYSWPLAGSVVRR